jgi:hypothetical protein
MPEDVIVSLHEYARFLGSSLDHVVIEALKLVFKKDADFKTWRIQQQNSPPKPAATPESSAPALSPLFSEYKRDRHRATGERAERVDLRIFTIFHPGIFTIIHPPLGFAF